MSRPTYFFARSDHSATDPLDGKVASSQPPGGDEAAAEDSLPLKQFAGQYWFVELPGGKHKALSTEEIAEVLKEGATVRSISGPFSTHDEASQSLERYWEMLMDREDN